LKGDAAICVADFARVIGIDAKAVVCVRVVSIIAGGGIGTTGCFIVIANSVTIGILEGDATVSVADFARIISVHARSSICGIGVKVARCAVLTSCDFIAVADTITIRVLDSHASLVIADFAVSDGKHT
jgi:hypothetical protein